MRPFWNNSSLWGILMQQEEVEEAQQKLDEAEHASRGGRVGNVQRALSQLLTPAFLEALLLTFIGGGYFQP